MFAVLFIPYFRLQAALRWRAGLDSRPVAIVDEHSKKSTVIECNEPALSMGVAPAMPSTQALARCPALTLLPRQVAGEQATQAIVLEMAFKLSPEVEATAEECCTIDLRRDAARRWESACPEIIKQLQALGLSAKIGVAPNPDLAFIAARKAGPVLVVGSPQAFLSQLAISEIDPPPHLLAILRDWGIHTLGRLTDLPCGEFADRLGPEAGQLWQRAAGKTTRLLHLVRPAEEFAEAFDFDGEIESLEPLYFALRRFLGQLCLRLAVAHRIAAKIDLTLPMENGLPHERSFTIPSPTGDAEALFRILSTHLDALHLDHRVTGVRLRIEATRPGRQQFCLFDNPLRDPNKFSETLARIIAIVGPENAGVAEPCDTHQPDSFRLAPPAFHTIGDGTRGETAATHAIGLPLRRYRPPFAAKVNMEQGRPAQVFSEKGHGEVLESLGPYRLSGNWWERDAWSTEEWDVEIADQGLFRISQRNGQWFIEGCYDAALR